MNFLNGKVQASDNLESVIIDFIDSAQFSLQVAVQEVIASPSRTRWTGRRGASGSTTNVSVRLVTEGYYLVESKPVDPPTKVVSLDMNRGLLLGVDESRQARRGGESGPTRQGSAPPVLDRQHGARSQPHHFLGHAAQEHVLEAGATVGTHDDEISVALLGDADNRVRRVPHGDLDIGCALPGTGHEVLELRQRDFTVISAYDGR